MTQECILFSVKLSNIVAKKRKKLCNAEIHFICAFVHMCFPHDSQRLTAQNLLCLVNDAVMMILLMTLCHCVSRHFHHSM